MMRKFFLFGTSAFWLAVVAVWAGSALSPAATVEAKTSTAKRYTLAEVARHSTPEDCWMAIGGKVYDLTAYLPDHPSRPDVILHWCGREASDAYRTKTKGRTHSSGADQLLTRYFIGSLAMP